MNRKVFALFFAVSAFATALPLWVGRALPAVDLPQHLFLIHVLGHLDDPALPFGQVYQAQPGLTYLTFYYTVRALAGAVGVETALKLWLTLLVVATPLSLLALLRALGRSPWPSLLAFPLLFTDNFYWGLVSFQSSLPFTFLTLACFAEALQAEAGSSRSRCALAGAGISLVLLQLTHAAGMVFPALALPVLLLATPSDARRRLRALGALLPGLALFGAWLLAGVGRGRTLGAPGEPWKASAPLLDPRNLTFDPLARRLGRFVELLANGFWDYADRPAIYAVAGAAAMASAVALGQRLRRTAAAPDRAAPPGSAPGAGGNAPRGPAGSDPIARARLPSLARARPLLLFLLALACYLLLPLDVRGYMYAVYPRYAQVAALLALPLLPSPRGRWQLPLGAAAAGVAVYAGVNLAVLFARFADEAATFEPVAARIPRHATIMHLVSDPGSGVATHAVYLHYAALAALRAEGIPSFSLALDPSFPVGYRPHARPPAPAWEWRPERFSWEEHASHYEYFLVRGPLSASQLFGQHASQVEPVAQSDRWRLFRRKAAAR